MHRIWRKLWKTWPTHIDDNPSLDNGIVRLPTTLEKMCRVLVEWIAEILPECQAPLSRAAVTERVQWVRRERELFLNNCCVKYSPSGRENILLKEFSNCLMITHLLDGKWSFILVVKLVSGDKNKGKFSFSWKTDNFTFKTVSWNVPLIKISILTSLMSENAHRWQSQSKSWKWAEFRFLQEFLFVLVSNVQLQFSW